MDRNRLVLLDYENTEAAGPIAVQIIANLARQHRATIHSSLEERAYQLLNNRVLQGCPVVYNAILGLRKPEELLQYEEYEEKVFEALLGESDAYRVVLLSSDNLDTVLKYCRPTLKLRPLLLRIEVDLKSRLLHMVAHCDSAEDLTEWLVSLMPTVAVQPAAVPLTPALLQPIIDTLVSDCSKQLLPPELVSLCERVAVLKTAFEASLQSLTQALRSTGEGKARQAEELRRSTEALRMLKTSQMRLLSVTKELTAKADVALDVLQAECTSQERSLESLSRTLASIAVTHQRHSPSLAVCAAHLNPDGSLEAEVESLKPYPIDGVVEVWEGEYKVLEKRAIFKGKGVVQLDGRMCQGSYYLRVKAESGEDLAKVYAFSIERQESEAPTRSAECDEEGKVSCPSDLHWCKVQERFEQSLVYSSVENLEEIETYLREQFNDYRVRLFHRAAGQWANPSQEGCQQLVQIFCRADLRYDGDLWKELQTQGFLFL